MECKLPIEPVGGSSETGCCLFLSLKSAASIALSSVKHSSILILHHHAMTIDLEFLSQSKVALGPVGAVEDRSSVGPYSAQRSTVLSSCIP